MAGRLTYAGHAKAVLGLGLPLVGSHVAQFLITLTDGIMLGRYSVEALAANVLGGTLFFVFFIVGSGFAWAVMPMVASAEARGETTEVRRVTRMGAWASIIFAVIVMPFMLFSEPIFLLLGQEAQVSADAAIYLSIVGIGVLPALLVMVLKSYLAALERTQVVLWVTVAAVGVNILVNHLLIYGNWGFPELGLRGAAIASVIVNIVSVLALAVYVARVTPEHTLFTRFWRPDWEALLRVFRLGWPIGLTSLAESGLFAASTVMMGWLGKVPLAAHGIALQVVSLAFMVHIGLSNAATVRAGRAFGRQDRQDLADGAKIVLFLSGAFAAMAVILFLLVPEWMILLFLNPDEPERDAVIAVGVGLLASAALFQLMDAAQVMALGLLRGVQDTRVPMIIAAISYWVIGIPVSYILGFVLGFEGIGVWIGLAVGLALAAVLLLVRFWVSAVQAVGGAENDPITG